MHPYVEAALAKDDIYALAAHLGLADLERLPAQPCLASRVETGIRIAAADLAFIDRVESALARRARARGGVALPRHPRRHRHRARGGDDGAARALARAIGERECRAAGRPFAGVRRYARGAAFLHPR